MSRNKAPTETRGESIVFKGGRLAVPDRPLVPFIEGDGIGPDIMNATRSVTDEGVRLAYGGDRRIAWVELPAGEKAHKATGEYLPESTVQAIAAHHVALKGPLTTPVGGGFRSLNVTLRQRLDLYACIRPVRYIPGVPSPVRHPEKVDVVIFRENTEDVYMGVESPCGSTEAAEIIALCNRLFDRAIRADSGIGIKPISAFGTRRICAAAIEYALAHGRSSVTIVHKGNIMKYTEGAFRTWCYETARELYGDRTVTEEQVFSEHGGKVPEGRLPIKDRIADSMFQQMLIRPDEYDVIVTPNLNGDYLSDACAAQVGGLGMAPGANVGDDIGLFEATHGTAPKYAGQDKVNPSSLILSACLMLEHMGWEEASALIRKGLEGAVAQKRVTYDLERQMTGATLVSCSGFGQAIVENMS